MDNTKQRSPLHLLWLGKYEKALSAMETAKKAQDEIRNARRVC